MEMDTRKKLKLRILGQYETITNFAKEIGYNPHTISDIISGERLGTVGLWEKVGKGLELTSAEIWEFQLGIWRLYKRDKANKQTNNY